MDVDNGYVVIFVLAIFCLPPYLIAREITGGNEGVSVAVGLVVGLLGIALCVYLLRRHEEAKQRRRDREYMQSGMAAIDSMTGVEFEHYVAARFRQAGWKVSTTAASGDYGVDLVASRDGQCLAVQCKRRGKSVGVSAVQQVVAGAAHHRCTSSMVVANQEFTKAANELAKTHRCRLVGRAELPNWIPRVAGGNRAKAIDRPTPFGTEWRL